MKRVIALAVTGLVALGLYASFTMPVKWDATNYKFGDSNGATYVTTYQAKNIYGMSIGEEFESTKLIRYWEEQWANYCAEQNWT